MAANIFIRAIFPVLIMIFGFIGNILLIIVLSRKKFSNFPIRNMFKIQSIADSVYLLQFLEDYFAHLYNLDIRNYSSFSCRIFRYFNYSLCPVSGWILVYISFERFISIKHTNRSLKLKKKKTQNFACLFIFLWNLIVYVPVFIFHDISQESTCDYIDTYSRDIIGLFDLINSTLLPFLFMFISSILIIYSIMKSRLKVHSKNFKYERLKRDIRFAINTVVLNLVFIIFNLPVCVMYVFSGYNTDLIALSALYILYTNFAINFYIFFIVNPFFRNECLIMLKLKKEPNQIILINKRKSIEIKY